MKHVLVTGANGFVGRNLCATLTSCLDLSLSRYDVDSAVGELDEALASADIVFHLAGVNRPQSVADFKAGNADFAAAICRKLAALGRQPKIVLSSSIQAECDNPYGISKRAAEEILRTYCAETGADGVVYRLKNLFGKWCRPNYNSVVATFCHNIAHGLPIQISNPANVVDLTHIDAVVAAFVGEFEVHASGQGFRMAAPLVSHQTTLGELANLIQSFRDQRTTLQLPDCADPFVRTLYSTYLSYLPPEQFSYPLTTKADARGSFTEFLRTPERGQVSVNISKPGIVKGNHWHHTKNEKFLVVSGEGVIRVRRVLKCENAGLPQSGSSKAQECENARVRKWVTPEGNEVIEYWVSGEKLEVVEIPPGYTHNIENLGDADMVTIMWASEPFDPAKPDTWAEKV
jgi:UDP-2-acetamido-2,6-beta-L-arabino-hexul-4-ose reductase